MGQYRPFQVVSRGPAAGSARSAAEFYGSLAAESWEEFILTLEMAASDEPPGRLVESRCLPLTCCAQPDALTDEASDIGRNHYSCGPADGAPRTP